jgi:phosphoglycolate phosphatase-like HAD superfamily hydrolase
MLCSKCAAPVRPVVAIDIDGTLAEYHSHLAEFAIQWLGFDTQRHLYHPYDGGCDYKTWFTMTFHTDITTFRSIKLAYRQGGQKRTQPLFNGAKELIHTVREAGAELWLTTTRPHDRFDRVDPDTREWLRRHRIEFDGLLYHDHKVRELIERVGASRIAVILDDQDDILYEARMSDIPAIQISRPSNQGDKWNGPTAKSLFDAANKIKPIIEEWTRSNG